MKIEIGATVELLHDYKGYTSGEITGQDHPYWIIRLHGSGLEIKCYEDEFSI